MKERVLNVKYRMNGIICPQKIKIEGDLSSEGEMIKNIREQLSLTFGQMKLITGYSPSYFCKIEKGTRGPTIEFAAIFTSAFNLPFNIFEDCSKSHSEKYKEWSKKYFK